MECSRTYLNEKCLPDYSQRASTLYINKSPIEWMNFQLIFLSGNKDYLLWWVVHPPSWKCPAPHLLGLRHTECWVCEFLALSSRLKSKQRIIISHGLQYMKARQTLHKRKLVHSHVFNAILFSETASINPMLSTLMCLVQSHLSVKHNLSYETLR